MDFDRELYQSAFDCETWARRHADTRAGLSALIDLVG